MDLGNPSRLARPEIYERFNTIQDRISKYKEAYPGMGQSRRDMEMPTTLDPELMQPVQADNGETIVFEPYDYGPLTIFNPNTRSYELSDMFIGDKKLIRRGKYYGKSPLGSFQFGLLTRHPNILPFYDMFMSENYMFLSHPKTDYSLAQMLGKDMISNPVYKMVHMVNLGKALDYIHQAGFVYCSLTPDSIFFRNGNILLGQHSLMLLQENNISIPCGSLAYKAPEFLGLKSISDAKSPTQKTEKIVDDIGEMIETMNLDSAPFTPSYLVLDKNLYRNIQILSDQYRDLVRSEYWSYAIICLHIYFDEREISKSPKLGNHPQIRKYIRHYGDDILQAFIRIFSESPENYGANSYLDILAQCFRPSAQQSSFEEVRFLRNDPEVDLFSGSISLADADDFLTEEELRFQFTEDPDPIVTNTHGMWRDPHTKNLVFTQPKTDMVEGREVVTIENITIPSSSDSPIRKRKERSESLPLKNSPIQEIPEGASWDYPKLLEEEDRERIATYWDDLEYAAVAGDTEKGKPAQVIDVKAGKEYHNPLKKQKRAKEIEEFIKKKNEVKQIDKKSAIQKKGVHKDQKCSACNRTGADLRKILKKLTPDSFFDTEKPVYFNEMGEEVYIINGEEVTKKQLDTKCEECGVPIYRVKEEKDRDAYEESIAQPHPELPYAYNAVTGEKLSEEKLLAMHNRRKLGKNRVDVNFRIPNVEESDAQNCRNFMEFVVNCFLKINPAERCELSDFLDRMDHFLSPEDIEEYITPSDIPIPHPSISEGDVMFKGNGTTMEILKRMTVELSDLYKMHEMISHPAVLFLSIDFYIQRCDQGEYVSSTIPSHRIFCRAIFWLMTRLLNCGYYMDSITIHQLSMDQSGNYIMDPQELYDLIRKIIQVEQGKFLFESIYHYIETESMYQKILDKMIYHPEEYISFGTPRNAYQYYLDTMPEEADIFIPKYFSNYDTPSFLL